MNQRELLVIDTLLIKMNKIIYKQKISLKNKGDLEIRVFKLKMMKKSLKIKVVQLIKMRTHKLRLVIASKIQNKNKVLIKVKK